MFIRKAWNALSFSVAMAVYLSYIFIGCIIIFIFSKTVPSRRARCYTRRKAKVLWLHLIRSTLHFYFPGEVFIQYDSRIEESQRNVVISNHLTEYDWLFVCSALHLFGRFENVCIILKRSLRDIPLLGYGMEFFQFVFLNRRLSKDEEIIEQGVSALKDNGRYDLLLFPEGTYIDGESHKKSKKWAKDSEISVNGRPFNPREVLVPRTNGFRLVHQHLADDMEGVIDMTLVGNPYIKYPQDTFTYSNVILNRPRGINFMIFIDYIPASEIANPEAFLLELFERKEALITRYRRAKIDGDIDTLDAFLKLVEKLGRRGEGQKYVVTDLSSRWGPLFFVLYAFGLALIIGSVVRLIRKYTGW
jgi:lysocardiolipin and lysophospholipid acyltransferase